MSIVSVGCAAPEERTDFRIVNGAEDPGDPAVAYLGVFEDPTGSIRSECSGTLIRDRWILTAAHCLDSDTLGFEPGAIVAYFGSTVLEEDDTQLFATNAVTYTIHGQWNHEAPELGFDAALVQLREPVPIAPIPIRPTPLASSDLGKPLRLVGWGITEEGGYDSGIKRFAMSQVFEYDDEIVMIGGPETNVCSGDSGGPALIDVNGQLQVLAVTSFVDPLCLEFGFGTRADTIAGWVEETIAASAPMGGGFGETCESPLNCASNVCVSDSGRNFCSLTCTVPGDCPGGWACFATEDESTRVCAPLDPTNETSSAGDSSDPMGESGLDGSDDDGDDGRRRRGCSVDPGAPPPPELLAYALLGAVGFASRRRRPRPSARD